MMMDILAESTARITVLALGVAVLLRVLRIRSPWLTHLMWTLVIAIMLVMPVFVEWGPEFDVPIPSSHVASEIFAPIAGDVAPSEAHTNSIGKASATGSQRRIAWTVAVGTVYVGGVALACSGVCESREVAQPRRTCVGQPGADEDARERRLARKRGDRHVAGVGPLQVDALEVLVISQALDSAVGNLAAA
jgi:hypothetical protein